MVDPKDDPFLLPGYRRRILVKPVKGAVLAMLEDDIHGLAVILRHRDGIVTSVEPHAERMPWDTCPGAVGKLIETFEGQPLSEVTARKDKKQNCTHLHDLAVLAAAHASEASAFTYDIAVSDPEDGTRILALRRDGDTLLRWKETDGVIVAPDEAKGLSLLTMRDWIASLPAWEHEAARILQWASLVAHGRTMPLDEQSNAANLPPNCYTFQPERAARAERIGDRFDFSEGSRVPLETFGANMVAALDGA